MTQVNEAEIKKRVNHLASKVHVVGQDVDADKLHILNVTSKQAVRVPLNITEISPLSRKDVTSNMIEDFLTEQFVSQKLTPCTFYEVLSLSQDVHMLSIYETQGDAMHEMSPCYQFLFTNFKQKEIIDEIGSIVTDHLVHVVQEQGDES